MQDYEYRILSTFAKSGERIPLMWQETLPELVKATVHSLINRGLLAYAGSQPDGLGGVYITHIALTEKGVLALASEKEERDRFDREADQKANDRAENNRRYTKDVRRSWWQFFLGLFFGWILGGFTFGEAVALLKELIH